MNAHTTIAAAGPARTKAEGHVFRSRIIDKFTDIETWAVNRLLAAGPKIRVPPTLGLRLQSVTKLAETQPHLFKDATVAAGLVAELKPFHELRSTLAHSTLTTICEAGSDLWCIFDPAVADETLPCRGRLTLKASEFGDIFCRLSSLANQLRQQVPGDDQARRPA